MTTDSWVEVNEDGGFGVENLPYGVFSRPGELPRVGVAIGEHVLDLAEMSAAGLVDDRRYFASGSLNAFMVAGRAAWDANRARLVELLTDGSYRDRVESHQVTIRAQAPGSSGSRVTFGEVTGTVHPAVP